jgi:hypothetical protein
MNVIKNRLKKLEEKAEVLKLFKGDIAPWALKHSEETIRFAETNFEKRMMEAYQAGRIPVPLIFTFPETEIKRRAEYYTKTYPNLQACIQGEDLKRKKMRAVMMPSILALNNAIVKEQERRGKL